MAEDHTQRRTILVLYGSETGNAQEIAEELGRLTERLRFLTNVVALDDVEVVCNFPQVQDTPQLIMRKQSLAAYSAVLISISTTGQGDMPSNSRAIWKKMLRKKLSPSSLEKAHVAIFGLGSTSYPQYNWAALKLRKRILQLGARELVPMGEGDDQHPDGYDGSFLPWSTTLRQRLLEKFPLEPGEEPTADDVMLQPQWTLTMVTEDNKLSGCNDPQDSKRTSDGVNGCIPDALSKGRSVGLPVSPKAVDLEVTLECNQRVTPAGHWQDVRMLSFMADTRYEYAPGDILTIYPRNPSEEVEQILDLMNWRKIADSLLHFVECRGSYRHDSIPQHQALHRRNPVTLRELLTNHFDFNAIPRRSFFANMAHFTQDEFQKNRLLEFTRPELIDEFYDYTTRPRRSILEVLQEFDTVKIPWHLAASVLPELRGRQFSIASGGTLKDTAEGFTKFDLLVAVVRYKTVIKKIRQGVCTRYLAGLALGTILHVTLKPGSLGLKSREHEMPMVLVGPGTGVAPLRSLIWERHLWYQQRLASTESIALGPTVLMFGSRNSNADYFFEDEWKRLAKKIPLQVITAFSRDQGQKIYVQDRIRENGQLIFRLLHELNGLIYVCGSSGKMPQAVREALVEVFQENKPTTREEAETYLSIMEKEGRYKQETW